MNCLNCTKLTNNNKFCTRKCATIYNNKLFPKRKISKTCKYCTKLVHRWQSQLCEDHHLIYTSQRKIIEQLTLQDYFERPCIKKLHKSSKYVHIRGFARTWFNYLTKLPCHNCDYSLHVEICHIKPISSFLPTAKIIEVNCRENLVQLCPNCHWELDHIGLPNLQSASQESNLHVTN